MDIVKNRIGVEKKFWELCLSVVQEQGLALYDLEFLPGQKLLRLYIMNPETKSAVIEDCINGHGDVTIARLFKKEKTAQILSFDKKADLAVLTTDVKLIPLKLSTNSPWPGYWVMALGSADSYQGSVAFGNVLNVTVEDILITNNISEGNSGGPLVDNEGKVVGIVTWGMDYKKRQYNGARILDVFCQKILDCDYEFDGDKTWFDYTE